MTRPSKQKHRLIPSAQHGLPPEWVIVGEEEDCETVHDAARPGFPGHGSRGTGERHTSTLWPMSEFENISIMNQRIEPK